MSDFESAPAIAEIETATPEERIRNKVEKNIRNWIQTDYAERVRQSALTKDNQQSIHWVRDKITNSNNLVRGLWALREGSTPHRLHELDQQIRQDLFDGPKAVVGIAGKDKRHTIESEIVGSISVLTCMDALRGVRKDLRPHLKLTEVLVPVGVDAEFATDMAFYFGDKNPHYSDAEIARILQLKTGNNSYPLVAPLDKQDRTYDPLGKLRERDLRQIHAYADLLEKNSDTLIDVRPYAMVVPSYNNSQIGNVFGIITGDRDVTLTSFAQLAEDVGFFPQKANANV
jgi:hypothetical protein